MTLGVDARVQEMAAGFYADVLDLTLTCDDVRRSGNHVIFVWTFTGHDASTGNPLKVRDWEEWEIGEDLKLRLHADGSTPTTTVDKFRANRLSAS